MKYAERVQDDPKVVTSVGLTSRARALLRVLAAEEGTSASAIVERLILACQTESSDSAAKISGRPLIS